MDEQCLDCRYYLGGDDDGICRRFPPVLIIDEEGATDAVHVEVASDSWCGEFRRRTGPNPFAVESVGKATVENPTR